MHKQIPRTRSIVILMTVALSIYVTSYLVLRQTHMIVHFESVLIPGHIDHSCGTLRSTSFRERCYSLPAAGLKSHIAAGR